MLRFVILTKYKGRSVSFAQVGREEEFRQVSLCHDMPRIIELNKVKIQSRRGST